MDDILRQSTAAVIPFGPFVNPTDGATLVTSLVSALDHASTGIFLSKNGGTGAVRHATVTATTYDSYGDYKVTLDTTDTGTLGSLRAIFANSASNLPVWKDYTVVPALVYDSLVLGTSSLSWSAAYASFQAAGTFGLAVSELTKKAAINSAMTAGSLLDRIMNKSGAQTFDATTDSLEAGTDAAPTLQQVINAIYDELRAVHVVAGSFGEGIASVQGNVTGNVQGVTSPVTPVNVDGLTFVQLMTRLYAVAGGSAVVTGDVVAFKDRSGATVATLTAAGPIKGNRTAAP